MLLYVEVFLYMFVNILFILLGFFLLIKGADYLVEGASNIAKKFHIPEIVIGLTIVAIGTSMPELMVSLNAAIKGLSEISIGNVIGSNLANLLLILGVTSIISPLIFKRETRLIESPFSLFVTILLFIFGNCAILGDKDIISRGEGIIL
jgi:cation:H+ antiporter